MGGEIRGEKGRGTKFTAIRVALCPEILGPRSVMISCREDFCTHTQIFFAIRVALCPDIFGPRSGMIPLQERFLHTHNPESLVINGTRFRECDTLQHTATHCNTLQHYPTHYSTPKHNACFTWALSASSSTEHTSVSATISGTSA